MLKSSSLILVNDHWTLDQVVVNCKWSHLLTIKNTENCHVSVESFTSNLDKLVGSIIWSTLREGSIEGIVVVLEFVVCEINTIEGQINPDFITSTKSRWGSTFHCICIDIVCGHESNWCVEVIILLHTSIISISFSCVWVHLSESAHDSLKSIGSVGESFTLEPDLCSSSNVSISWSDVVENWFLIVSEIMTSVNPINGVGRYFNLNSITLLSRWGCALNSCS